MRQAADLSENYGNGHSMTVGQNLIISSVPDNKIGDLTAEPILRDLRYDPSEVMRGLVSCTGMDYCHFALIETKGWALKTARVLEKKMGKTQPLRMHWSGFPYECGNHRLANIGLWGKYRSPAKSSKRWMYLSEEPAAVNRTHPITFGRCSLRRSDECGCWLSQARGIQGDAPAAAQNCRSTDGRSEFVYVGQN